jgi:hypothetical protein
MLPHVLLPARALPLYMQIVTFAGTLVDRTPRIEAGIRNCRVFLLVELFRENLDMMEIIRLLGCRAEREHPHR